MARMDISMEKVELGAQTGAPDALFELGMLYATGRDVAADLVVAHKWFNLAAKCRPSRSPRRRSRLASGCKCIRGLEQNETCHGRVAPGHDRLWGRLAERVAVDRLLAAFAEQ
jgi:hypothetical protein